MWKTNKTLMSLRDSWRRLRNTVSSRVESKVARLKHTLSETRDDVAEKAGVMYDYVADKAAEAKSSVEFHYANTKYRLRLAWNNERVQDYRSYVLFEGVPYVVVYGVLLNFVLNVFVSVSLSPAHVVALGLLFYFVEVELPAWVQKLYPRAGAREV